MIYTVKGRETITGLDEATGFTEASISPTAVDVIYAVVQALDQAVRFCIDGTTPEAALGMRLTANSSVEIWGDEALGNFLAIEEAASASLEVIYMGRK